MKINHVLLLALSALLCLPGCWGCKKRCNKDCSSIEQKSETKEVALTESKELENPNLLVLDEDISITVCENETPANNKNISKF